MAAILLDTVRDGVSLLSGVLREADTQGYENGRVSKKDVENMIDLYADMNGGSFADALRKVHKYARKRYDTKSPSVDQINKALATGMSAIAKADANGNDDLSTQEQADLAKTWKAIVRFAEDFSGMTVEQMTSLSE